MHRRSIHLFFSLIFIAFICAPTMVSLVDKNIDVSVFYSLNEDEGESEKNEIAKDVELIVIESHNPDDSLIRNKRNVAQSREKTYFQFYINLSSPPPKYI